jgi:hypothetical protein
VKQIIEITEFLQTGVFGDVRINDSIEIVIKKLGKPDGGDSIKSRNSRKMIHYGMYEFMFTDNKLQSIQNDSFDTKYPELMEFDGENIVIDSGLMRADRVKYLKDVEKTLAKLNIKFEIIDYWERKAIKTEGNIIIDFNNGEWCDTENSHKMIDNIENYKLIGFRYHPLYTLPYPETLQ